MRRFIFSFFPLVLLLSCAKESPLPSEEVLRRSALASHELTSVRFEVEAKISGIGEGEGISVEASIDGRLQDSGEQFQFILVAQGAMNDGSKEYDVEGEMEVIVAGEEDTYVKVNSLSTDPPHPLLLLPLLEGVKGQWWQLPPKEDGRLSVPVTPDPRLLRIQSEVVKVVQDRGLTRIGGRSTYHYDVSIAQEKLLVFLTEVARERGEEMDRRGIDDFFEKFDVTGELWIDTETFYIRRLKWTFLSKEKRDDEVFVTFRVDFRDHNAAPNIVPPQGASPFFLPLSGIDIFQDVIQNMEDSSEDVIPSEVEGEFIDKLPQEG